MLRIHGFFRGFQVKVGLVMNLFTIVSLCLVMETVGEAMFDLHAPVLPFWADGARRRANNLRLP